ncbi:hypothetical protein BACCIP111899_04007 [Bacillus rhizoplanae]|uniref:Uncharacterized protein n=1 Tax=Bacillus rhizoplanae TaxID=2880966 RepID=A0ABM8YG12_9BACI|nr:hypothetical protein BACCIP111899_04007 [Bacillus rhizoplanae]
MLMNTANHYHLQSYLSDFFGLIRFDKNQKKFGYLFTF